MAIFERFAPPSAARGARFARDDNSRPPRPSGFGGSDDEGGNGGNGGPLGPLGPGGPSGGQKPNGRITFIYLIIAVICAVYLFWTFTGPTTQGQANVINIPTNEFTLAVEQGLVQSVTFHTSTGALDGTVWVSADAKKSGEDPIRFTSTYAGTDSLDELMARNPSVTYLVDNSDGDFLSSLLFSLIPTLLLVGVMVYFMSRMQNQNSNAMQFGKTKAQTNEATRPNVTFDDVAGIDEAVEELREVRDFLAEPERFRRLGAKIPHGVLLVGQDAPREGGGRRGGRAVLLHLRLRLRGDVRGRGREPRARPLQAGEGAGAGHHLHRRDRRGRPPEGCRPRWRP